jgi:hypothetical protein
LGIPPPSSPLNRQSLNTSFSMKIPHFILITGRCVSSECLAASPRPPRIRARSSNPSASSLLHYQVDLTGAAPLLCSHRRDMSAHFYTYRDPIPSAVNIQPAAWHWEDPADWPRTFLYVSNPGDFQGIHPPAPVYQSNQPAQSTMYYFQVSLHKTSRLPHPSDTSILGQCQRSSRLLCQWSLLWHKPSLYLHRLALQLLWLHLLCPSHSSCSDRLALLPLHVLTILYYSSTSFRSLPIPDSSGHVVSARCRPSSRRGRSKCHCRSHAECAIILCRSNRCGDPSSERRLACQHASCSATTNPTRSIQAWLEPSILVQRTGRKLDATRVQ